MADIAFDPFSILDPARERLQVEAVNGPTFTNFSALDDALMRRQVEVTAGAGTIFSPFSHDPALAEQQMKDKVHGHAYKAKAVQFDASTFLLEWVSSVQNMAPASSKCLCSAWMFLPDGTDLSVGWGTWQLHDGNGIQLAANSVGFNNTGGTTCLMFNGNNGQQCSIDTATGTISTGTWYHYLFSGDFGFAANSKILQYYISDTVLPGTTVTDNLASTTFDFTTVQGTTAFMPDQPGAMTLAVADVQLYPGIAPDLSIEATRRLFISASGKPINPSVAIASLGVPAVLLSGDAAKFANNQGSGGALAVTRGTLTDASSSPSD